MGVRRRLVAAGALVAVTTLVGASGSPAVADATCTVDAGPALTTTCVLPLGASSWTVPSSVTTVSVDIAGGSGGPAAIPGRGARLLVDLDTTPGQTLGAIVGAQGAAGTLYSRGGGGGGGSFLFRGDAADGDLLVAAGGGGGAGSNNSGVDATLAADGTAGNGASPGAGGTDGAGGEASPDAAGGGQGWLDVVAGGNGAGGAAYAYYGGGGGGYSGGGGGAHLLAGTFLWAFGGGGGSSYSVVTPTETGYVTGDGHLALTYTTLRNDPAIDPDGRLTNTVVLSGEDGRTGTLTVRLYGPGDPTCTTPLATATLTAAGDGGYTTPEYTPTEDGEHRWTTEYTRSGEGTVGTTTCEDAATVTATVPPPPTAPEPPAEPEPERAAPAKPEPAAQPAPQTPAGQQPQAVTAPGPTGGDEPGASGRTTATPTRVYASEAPPTTTTDGSDDLAAGPSALTDALPTASELLERPERLVAQLVPALVWVLFLLILAQLFGESLDERIARARERLLRRFPRLAAVHAPTRAWPRLATIGVAVVLVASASWLTEVGYGFAENGWRLFASTILGTLIATIVPRALAAVALRARWGVRTSVRASWWAVAAAVIGVALSRALGFIPGLLQGTVARLDADRTSSPDAQARTDAVRAWSTFATAILAWTLAGLTPMTGTGELLIRDALAVGAVGGIGGLFVELLPLDALPGGELIARRRWQWLALTALTTLAFGTIVLPDASNWIEVPQVQHWMLVAGGASAVLATAIVLLNVIRPRPAPEPASMAAQPNTGRDASRESRASAQHRPAP